MSLHHIDPNHGQECPADTAWANHRYCTRCHGTGRLGIPGAEPEIVVIPLDAVGKREQWAYGFGIAPLDKQGLRGPYPSESAALAAARAAARGE